MLHEGIPEKSGPVRSSGVRMTTQTIASEPADTSRESTMSLTNQLRSVEAATLAHPAGRPIPQTPGGGNTSVLDGALIGDAIAKGPHPPSTVGPARVNPGRDAEVYRFADPSNYLG
jgi:hypothetical protein